MLLAISTEIQEERNAFNERDREQPVIALVPSEEGRSFQAAGMMDPPLLRKVSILALGTKRSRPTTELKEQNEKRIYIYNI